MTASKLDVSHHFLCDAVFEHGLSATLGEVQAAARLWAAASDSVSTEDDTQAPGNLRARSEDEEKGAKREMEPPTKKIRMRCS